jgi:hypothetical protein
MLGHPGDPNQQARLCVWLLLYTRHATASLINVLNLLLLCVKHVIFWPFPLQSWVRR